MKSLLIQETTPIQKEFRHSALTMDILYSKIKSSQLLRLVSIPSYRSFILSVSFSQMAINMTNVVAIFLVYYLTSSNFLVSLLVLSFMLPQIVFSFIGGVVADIKGKKNILFYGNIFRAIIFVLLFFYTKSLGFIYIASFLVSIISQFYITAETPMIPKLVKKNLLISANSIFGVSLFGSILIGYVIAGPLIKFLGRENIFLFIAALFLGAAYFIHKIPNVLFASTHIQSEDNLPAISYSIIKEFQKTYSVLINTAKVIGPFLLLTFSQVIVLMLATIVPGYANSILEVQAEDLSLLLFGPASLGMMISSLLIGGIWNKKNRQSLMTTGLLISGIVLCLFPVTSRIATRQIVHTLNFYLPHILDITPIHFAITLSFLAGFSNALIFVPSHTIIQEKIPEDFRAKVYGLIFGMVGLLSLVPILITGGLADIVGVGKVLFIVGSFIIFFSFSRIILGLTKFKNYYKKLRNIT